MLTDFISITNLQKNLKQVFGSKQPIRIVMSKNAVSGLVFNRETAKMLMESGTIDHLLEELWELNDPETLELVARDRVGKTSPIPFDSYLKKHGIRHSGRR